MAKSLSHCPSSGAANITLESYHLLTECLVRTRGSDFHQSMQKKHKSRLMLEDLEKVKEYDLVAIASEVGIDDNEIGRLMDSNVKNEEVAVKVLRQCFDGNDNIHQDKILRVNQQSISILQDCYCNPEENRGDAVIINSAKTTVLFVEVHSSSFVPTAKKTVLLLFHYLRLLKCFRIADGEVYAFVFPCKGTKRCAVQVAMHFDSVEVVFRYSVQCLSVSDIKAKLQNAERANRLVLSGSNDYLMDPNSEKHSIYLTQQQVNSIATSMNREYSNFQLAQCHYGVLLMNDRCCLKKPLYKASITALACLSNLGDDFPFIRYRPLPFGFFSYQKVRYGPLSHVAAISCGEDLVRKMKGVFDSLERHNICHGDVCLPNICFNEDLSPVLIDFVVEPNKERDIEIFGDELQKIYDEDDQFITNLQFGFFDEELLASSVIHRRSTHTLLQIFTEN